VETTGRIVDDELPKVVAEYLNRKKNFKSE